MANCKAKNSLFCENVVIWVCIPNQFLTESLTYQGPQSPMLNGWKCCLKHQGATEWPKPQLPDCNGSSSQTGLQRDKPPSSVLYLATIHWRMVWSAGTPWWWLPAAASQSYLSWASSLGFQGAPGVSIWRDIAVGPKMWARWLCCVCEEYTCYQGILKHSVCLEAGSTQLSLMEHSCAGFSVPGGAHSSTDDFFAVPELVGVPDQGVLQLSLPFSFPIP